MKFLKITSVLILSAVFFSAFIPEASARYGCKRRSSFGMSFNVGGPARMLDKGRRTFVLCPFKSLSAK